MPCSCCCCGTATPAPADVISMCSGRPEMPIPAAASFCAVAAGVGCVPCVRVVVASSAEGAVLRQAAGAVAPSTGATTARASSAVASPAAAAAASLAVLRRRIGRGNGATTCASTGNFGDCSRLRAAHWSSAITSLLLRGGGVPRVPTIPSAATAVISTAAAPLTAGADCHCLLRCWTVHMEHHRGCKRRQVVGGATTAG